MELTRRQLVAAVPLAIGALALSGCGSDPQPSTADPKPQQQAEPQPPLDLAGTWRQTNSGDPDNTWMEAVITADSISVNWVMDAGATTALYWQGTYAAPTGPSDTYSWTSTSTLDPNAVNIMASQDASMDAGATTALYWQGTYAAPTGPSDTYSWTSTSTLDPNAVNIMASQDASKDFTYTGGKLTWQQSALGVTTTIECERV